jgi:uncharacterized membrane protein YvlD (DUF360 family)
MKKESIQKIEKYSNAPLVFIGFGRIIFLFVLNIWLLWNVADALSEATNLKHFYILGSLIGGSLLGISYPIVYNRYKNNDEFDVNSEITIREKRNLDIIKMTIFCIQAFVLYNFIYTIIQNDTLNHHMITWGIFNVVIGVMVDFIVGSEFSTYIERHLGVKKEKPKEEPKKESNPEKVEVPIKRTTNSLAVLPQDDPKQRA